MSSRKYYLRSTQASSSSSSSSSSSAHQEERGSYRIGTDSSGSTETPIAANQPPSAPSVSPFFTGYIPIFRPVYKMSQSNPEHPQGELIAQAEQIDIIGGSQDQLNQLPGLFHDAQEMQGDTEEELPVLRDESSQQALNTVDNEHKQNKINSLLE